MEILPLVICIILFILGLLGTVLPVLPGAILIYGGMLIYGIMTGFESINVNFFLLQALILIIIFLIDFIASIIGTRHFGGSKQAIWGAGIGTILGLILMPPIGIFIGPFLGAVIAEILLGNELQQAVRVGIGSLIGILGGTLLKLCMEIIMIIYFFIHIYLNTSP
ncbi:MAG: DUF456 domain-containing protein [Thermoanaerobacteraceae bacterium]|nr:DUF456 domain-containing protein [Thermoanaerobacteraceae bacterium]